MNNSEALVSFLVEQGVTKFFMLCGGGAMTLNDAVCQNPHAEAVFLHHEQSCAMAAVAYTRRTGIPAAVMVTTGCGVTNAMTGLLDAWQDSVPVVFISGAVGTKYMSRTKDVRHLGVQDSECQKLVEPLTKCFVQDMNELNSGWKEMMSGRKGPIWIEFPLNYQNETASIHSQYLKKISDFEIHRHAPIGKNFTKYDKHLRRRLKKSKRPLLLLGNGIRQSRTVEEVNKLIYDYDIPFVTTYGGRDISNKKNQWLDMGTVGIKGNRAANFAMQNCDLLLVLGSSLSTPVVGYNFEDWAREADIIIVDVDEKEHEKYGDFDQLFIQHELSDFFRTIDQLEIEFPKTNFWETCMKWKKKWPILKEERRSENGHDFYKFMDNLMEKLNRNNQDERYQDIAIVGDAGSAYYVPSQTFNSPGNKLITPMAQAEMGATIPYSIGCAIDGKKVIGITGDGSFMTNLQELQVIEQLDLPVLLFVWNNGGYLSIRNTQENYFDERYFGTDENSGLKISNIEKMSDAFGIEYKRIHHNIQMKPLIWSYVDHLVHQNKPLIVEVDCATIQDVFPTIGAQEKDGVFSSQPLENMKPFLDEEEFKEEMIVSIIE